jgi:periplasmic divalent cation tolerance protein
VLGVFVYGTLRPGSWNHDRWLAPFLAGPCRPAVVGGLALHHHDRLPMVVPAAGAVVVGEVADLAPDRYDDGIALLDELEDTAGDEYRRVRVATTGGEDVWVWVAGAVYSAALGAATLVPSGDWFDVPGAR